MATVRAHRLRPHRDSELASCRDGRGTASAADHVNVQAMDARSFWIGAATLRWRCATRCWNMNAINDVVNELTWRLFRS